MISDKILIFFFIIMSFSEILSQYFLKKGSYHNNVLNLYFYLGLIAIIITYIFLYLVMRSGKHLSIIHAIHHTFIAIFLAFGSYYLFSQKLTHIQLFAIILVICGTFILAISDKDH